MKGSEKQLKWANDSIQKIKTAWEFAKNDKISKNISKKSQKGIDK